MKMKNFARRIKKNVSRARFKRNVKKHVTFAARAKTANIHFLLVMAFVMMEITMKDVIMMVEIVVNLINILWIGMHFVMIVNVKRKRNVKMEQQEIIARKIKRNAIKKRFIKDVRRLATSVVVMINAKMMTKNFAKRTKRNVTKRMLKRNARRPVENANCYINTNGLQTLIFQNSLLIITYPDIDNCFKIYLNCKNVIMI